MRTENKTESGIEPETRYHESFHEALQKYENPESDFRETDFTENKHTFDGLDVFIGDISHDICTEVITESNSLGGWNYDEIDDTASELWLHQTDDSEQTIGTDEMKTPCHRKRKQNFEFGDEKHLRGRNKIFGQKIQSTEFHEQGSQMIVDLKDATIAAKSTVHNETDISKPNAFSDKVLSLKGAEFLMVNAKDVKSCLNTARNPKSGDIYIFSEHNEQEDLGRLVKDDGLKWKCNGTRKTSDITRRYYSLDETPQNSNVTKMIVYHSFSKGLYLVHYPHHAKKNDEIEDHLARAILEKEKLPDASNINIENPNSDEMFSFGLSNIKDQFEVLLKEQLNNDGYKWKKKYETLIEKSEAKYTKIKYHIKEGSTEITSFKKYIYLDKDNGVMLIHYVGSKESIHKSSKFRGNEPEKTEREREGNQIDFEQMVVTSNNLATANETAAKFDRPMKENSVSSKVEFSIESEKSSSVHITGTENFKLVEPPEPNKEFVLVTEPNNSQSEVLKQVNSRDEPVSEPQKYTVSANRTEQQNFNPNCDNQELDSKVPQTNIIVLGLTGILSKCCSRPLEDIQQKLIFCRECRDFFCSTCNGETVELRWICLFCKLKNVGGMHHSQCLSGMCTILTALTIKTIQKPGFLDLINVNHEQDTISAHQTLQKVIRFCVKKEFDKAHDTWHNFIVEKCQNLHDKNNHNESPVEIIFKFIRQGGTFTRLSQCTNRKCSKPKSEDEFYELYLEEDDQLENIFRFTNCKYCQKRRNISISMPYGQHSWYLLVENGICNYTTEQLMKLESHILIGNSTFELSLITQHHKETKHFTSLHFIDDEWVFYDCLSKDENRFRKPTTEDYAQTALNVLYLPVMYDKQPSQVNALETRNKTL